MKLMLINPIQSTVSAFTALVKALSDPLSLDSWTEAGAALTGVFDNYKQDWTDIKNNVDDTIEAFDEFTLRMMGFSLPEKAKDLKLKFIPGAIDIPLPISVDEDVLTEAEDTIKIAITDVEKKTKDGTAKMMRHWRGVGSSARALWDELEAGKVTISSLVSLLGAVVPGGGFLGMLGGFLPFDDPVNDAYLRREQRKIGRLIADGISQGMSTIVAPQAEPQNIVTIHIASGVNARDFSKLVKSEIVPIIEEMNKKGSTNISVKRKRIMR